MTPIVPEYGEVQLGSSPLGTTGGYAMPYCEDFNEQLTGCPGATSNLNACHYNTISTNNAENPASNTAVTATGTAFSAFAAIPGDPSFDPNASTTSTVCGNGRLETYEDCDNGTPGTPGAVNGGNGSPGNNCSVFCRNVLP
jgi:hypothetical protein